MINKFKNDIKIQFKGIETAFRGRPLHGVINELPKTQIGLIIDYSVGKNEQVASSLFNKVHSWQLDEPLISHNTDKFSKALKEWYDISEIVSD